MKRLNFSEQSPKLVQKLLDLSQASKESSIPTTIHDLVTIRASQINGCGFCLDMHVKEAKIHGERDLRLFHIAVWSESPLFNEKERAALEWTEAVTKLTGKEVPAEIYVRVREFLSEKELSDLTFAIGIINMWNRLNVSFPMVPGSMDQMLGLTKAGLN